MDIIYLGHSSFKISGKDASLITDPFDPGMLGLKFPKVSADIVTVSHDHKDHNFTSGVTDVHKILQGPGEYEIKGISIIGIPTFHDTKKGAERGKNTIYVFEIDGFRLAHLGDLGHTLDESVVEDIGDIDILFTPIGGFYTIGAEEAVAVVRAIEPNIVIPMHYKTEGLNEEIASKLEPAETFVSSLGLISEKTKKYSVKLGTILPDELKLVILERL